jgi:hypothetical protein
MKDPQDVAEFRQLMADCYAFYQKDLTESVLSIWWNALRAYELLGVRDALGRHVVDADRGQFLPKPADVVRLIDGGTADAALVAWQKVDAAVKLVGSYQSVVFDDPVTQRCVHDLGGWPYLGSRSEKEWPFVRTHFCNLYRAYLMRGKITFPPRLPGLTEIENTRTGFPVPLPVLIGDEARARAVIEKGRSTGLIEVHHSTPKLLEQ